MLDRRVQALTVRAAAAGRVAIDAQRTRLGQYVEQGDLIAHVLPAGAPMVRALVRNVDIALVRETPGEILVALAHGDSEARRGVLAGAVPRATHTLPTPSLGENQGGPIALDASDPSGRTAREPRFQLDLRLEGSGEAPVGARAMVTFVHGQASAAELLARLLRQSFLRWFER
jgi:putative peptide zinc metalloprotease protein